MPVDQWFWCHTAKLSKEFTNGTVHAHSYRELRLHPYIYEKEAYARTRVQFFELKRTRVQ